MMKKSVFVSAMLFAWFSPLPAVAVQLGEGVNSNTGELQGTCISFKSEKHDTVQYFKENFNKGTSPDGFDLIWIENREKLKRTLNLSADAYIKAALGKGSLKANYASSLSISTYSLNFLIKVEVDAGTHPIKEIPQIRQDSKQLTPEQFFAKCGDRYVHALQTGGTLFVAVSVDTNSKSEQRRIQTAINSKWLSGGFSANVASALDRVLDNKQFSIVIRQIGGEDTNAPSSNSSIAGFFDYYNQVRNSILSKPKALGIETRSYRNIDPTISITIPIEQRRSLKRLARTYERILTYSDDLSEVIAKPRKFFVQDIDFFKDHAKKVDNIKTNIKDSYDECLIGVELCQSESAAEISDETSNIVDLKLPELNPVFAAIEFPTETSTAVADLHHSQGNCTTWYHRQLTPQNLSLSKDNKTFSYGYKCQVWNGKYQCGSGGVDLQFHNNVDYYPGTITGTIDQSSGSLQISNLSDRSAPGQPPRCSKPLLDHIKSKIGSIIR